MRIDMTTREWHELVRPVLPHASKNKELPQYGVIRLQPGERALYAIATDQYTLAAERHPQLQGWPGQPVDLAAAEVAASIKLLPYGKDADPQLSVTIDTARVPLTPGHSVTSLAVTLERLDDGLRIVLRDRRDPSLITALDSWRTVLRKALRRPRGQALDGLDLPPLRLARWKDATRGAERLRLYTGPKPGDPLLLTVERHFAGIMAIPQYLDDPAMERDELPWIAELGDTDADPGTGEKQ